MEERAWWSGLALLALGLVFVLVSAQLWACGGRSRRLLRAKLRLGGLLLGFSAVAAGCGEKDDSAMVMCYDAGWDSDTVQDQDIEVDTTAMDFGSVAVGDTAQQSLTVRNNGTLALTVDSVVLSDAEGPFSVDVQLPLVLAAEEAQSISVTFSPVDHGAAEDVLAIHSDDPDHPTIEVNLAGEGIVP